MTTIGFLLMLNQIYSRYVASISDLKKNPMETVNNAHGEVVAILNRNTPAFYCVPAELYEKMMDLLEDQALIKIANERENQPTIEISPDDLQARIQRKSP